MAKKMKQLKKKMNTIPIIDIQQALKDEPTFIVDGLPIFLDPTHTNISIDVSGGADSALLAYLIISELNRRKQKCVVHIITHRRLWDARPWQKKIAENVFEWLRDMSNPTTVVRHTNFIPPLLEMAEIKLHWRVDPKIIEYHGHRTGECICVDGFRDMIMSDYNIDMRYNATTMNPPIQLEGSMPSRDKTKIDKLDLLSHRGEYPCYDRKETNPFIYINKAWVIKQYKDNNILDLLYTTRSCEGGDVSPSVPWQLKSPAEWDGLRPDDCGECFWCAERHWAMDENNVDHC
jgi:hypothetical protein